MKIRNRLPIGRRLLPRVAHRMEDYRKLVAISSASKKVLQNADAAAENSIAVIVHLYYPDMWPLISAKLKRLKRVTEFDLFVTIQSARSPAVRRIAVDFPSVRLIELPNHGRDVFPFMVLLPLLKKNGYAAILKLHSKKSPHRSDGRDWFNSMLSSLLPSKRHLMEAIVNKLEHKNTGIIGPAGQYTSLVVNFEANGSHMTNILRRVYKKNKVFTTLQSHRSDYGFFAGTMFWARLDALGKIIEAQITPNMFELESGQIDGTLSHAIERLLCVIPEIENKVLYESSEKGLTPIHYNSGIIPEWSDKYPGKK